MKPLRIFCTLLWLLIFVSAARAEKYAVIIGIGSYPDSSLLSRLTADKDTTRLASALRGQGWTVLLLNSTSPGPSTRIPSRQNVMNALGIQENNGAVSYGGSSEATWLGPNSLTHNDTILLYYGGHGITNQQSGTDYIIPVDATPNGTTFPISSLISLPVIETAIAKTGAQNYIMLTDACRNGTVVRDGTLDTPRWRGAGAGDPTGKVFQQGDAGVRYFIFKSTDRDRSSYEWSEQESGVYSFFIQKLLTDTTAMKEADTSPKDNCVSLFELSRYVTTQTLNFVQDRYNAQQVPIVSRDGSDWDKSFCLVKYKPSVEPDVGPAPGQPSGPSPGTSVPAPVTQTYTVGIYVGPYRFDQPPSSWQFFIDSSQTPLPTLYYAPNYGAQVQQFSASPGPHTFRATVVVAPIGYPPLQAVCSGSFNVLGPATYVPWWPGPGRPDSGTCTLTQIQ